MKKKTYTFNIKPVGKGRMKKITIDSSKSLSEFDSRIRNAMDYDSWDHLSGFYEGKPFRSTEFATVSPDGGGENSEISIGSLNLQSGDNLGYVYDFGDNVQSILIVEEIN